MLEEEKNMKWLSRKFLSGLLALSLLLGACAPLPAAVPVVIVAPSATPAASLTPAPLPTQTLVPPVSDEVWDRITANQKMVVGVTWDYPPFASVDPNFQVVGLDIALIRAIGQRLNVPIDIQNFTFEGLESALQLNQIDLAIAAISITPERAGQMSFSPVYYVNQTAVVARNDSAISITNFNQLAGFRVGVQRGTTYESMLTSQLVETGLMNANQVLSYRQADEAIRDLVANRVDLVLIGQATASYYRAESGLKVVGSGFGQQDLAVAMRLGTPRLKAEIDRVIDELLTDGTLLGLIQEYSQDEVAAGAFPTRNPSKLSTATPVPPVATLAPPVCLDGMRFVADVTLGDNNMRNPAFLQPGASFVKVWRIQNTGTCTWTSQYRLVYAYGNVAGAQMNGQPLNLPGNVTAGQMIDLGVTLLAPQQPYTYQGFWQMENAAGRRFGQTIWVGISTLDDPSDPRSTLPPASTVQPPAGSYCQVTLTAPKTPITVKASFDAVWTVTNISGSAWSEDSVDYKYISGTELHETALYDFPATVKDGESTKIIVDMMAPPTPGIYNTKWAIVAGSQTLCILNVSVTVVDK